jgi:hypothetical protein
MAGVDGFEEVFGLFPELLQIRTSGQRLGHGTFLLKPEVRWTGSIKVVLLPTIGRWAQPFPRTRMRPERDRKGPKAAQAVKHGGKSLAT